MVVLLLILIRAVKNAIASGATGGRDNPFCVARDDEVAVGFDLSAGEIFTFNNLKIAGDEFIDVAGVDIFRSIRFLEMNKEC